MNSKKRGAPKRKSSEDLPIPIKHQDFNNASPSTSAPPELTKTIPSPDPKIADTGASTMLSQSSQRLGPSFFKHPCTQLAKQLLGQILVRVVDKERLAGRIVETEAYVGADDTACHTFNGRQTPSNKSMFLSPGHAYVYLTYGMYHCINITSEGEGQAVLIRALTPTDGTVMMTKHREKASKRPNRQFKTKDLCNGPGKLCMALDITRSMDGTNIVSSDSLWIESGDQISDGDIVSCPRIGIDSATKEWVEKPLRFYVKGDPCVSKRNRSAEDIIDKST